MKTYFLIFFSLLLIVVTSSYAHGQSNTTFTIKANEVKGTIQPTMWGIFFEDINLAADGGEPFKIKPVDKQISLNGKTVSLMLAPYSVSVVRIKMK